MEGTTKAVKRYTIVNHHSSLDKKGVEKIQISPPKLVHASSENLSSTTTFHIPAAISPATVVRTNSTSKNDIPIVKKPNESAPLNLCITTQDTEDHLQSREKERQQLHQAVLRQQYDQKLQQELQRKQQKELVRFNWEKEKIRKLNQQLNQAVIRKHNFLQLKRSKIRSHPWLEKRLKSIWAFLSCVNSDGNITQKDFFTIYSAILRKLLGENNDIVEGKVIQSIWESFCRESNLMDYFNFSCSLFFLTEMWVKEIRLCAYEEFLKIVKKIVVHLDAKATSDSYGDDLTLRRLKKQWKKYSSVVEFRTAQELEKVYDDKGILIGKSILFDSNSYIEYFNISSYISSNNESMKELDSIILPRKNKKNHLPETTTPVSDYNKYTVRGTFPSNKWQLAKNKSTTVEDSNEPSMTILGKPQPFLNWAYKTVVKKSNFTLSSLEDEKVETLNEVNTMLSRPKVIKKYDAKPKYQKRLNEIEANKRTSRFDKRVILKKLDLR